MFFVFDMWRDAFDLFFLKHPVYRGAIAAVLRKKIFRFELTKG